MDFASQWVNSHTFPPLNTVAWLAAFAMQGSQALVSYSATLLCTAVILSPSVKTSHGFIVVHPHPIWTECYCHGPRVINAGCICKLHTKDLQMITFRYEKIVHKWETDLPKQHELFSHQHHETTNYSESTEYIDSLKNHKLATSQLHFIIFPVLFFTYLFFYCLELSAPKWCLLILFERVPAQWQLLYHFSQCIGYIYTSSQTFGIIKLFFSFLKEITYAHCIYLIKTQLCCKILLFYNY